MEKGVEWPIPVSNMSRVGMSSRKHTAIVVDDHALVRDGIRNLLGKIADIEVIAEAGNGIEAISLVKQHKPTLVILDLAMPYANGIEVLEEVRRFSPDTRVIILTGSAFVKLINQAIDGGADGLLLKLDDGKELLDAIPRILNGERVISRRFRRSASKDDGVALTRREAQILQAIARGESNKEIARRINISPTTVNNHRANIMRKFDAHSAAELITLAVKEGLVDSST